MVERTFTISCEYGDQEFEMEISDRDDERIEEAIESGEDFCDAEGLEKLYKRVHKAAREYLKECISISIYEGTLPEDASIENTEYTVNFY